MARIARWSVLRLMVHFHRLHIHAETLSWRMWGILIHLLDIVVPIRPRLGVDQAKCMEQLKTSARMILQVACFLQIYLPRLIASAPHVARDPQTSFQAGHRMDNWTSKSSMSCPEEKILIPLSRKRCGAAFIDIDIDIALIDQSIKPGRRRGSRSLSSTMGLFGLSHRFDWKSFVFLDWICFEKTWDRGCQTNNMQGSMDSSPLKAKQLKNLISASYFQDLYLFWLPGSSAAFFLFPW